MKVGKMYFHVMTTWMILLKKCKNLIDGNLNVFIKQMLKNKELAWLESLCIQIRTIAEQIHMEVLMYLLFETHGYTTFCLSSTGYYIDCIK